MIVVHDSGWSCAGASAWSPALLLREVTAAHRTTVTPMNSMMTHPAFSFGAITPNALAGVAMVVGAVVLTLSAPLCLPAARRQSVSV
ncbi:hypothetical protein [Actinophytocola sp.]|uniref:hypothetical protein n=1 Tax=Actinophytocola sp. TaxID=1872138 RepID=UPI00389A59C2